MATRSPYSRAIPTPPEELSPDKFLLRIGLCIYSFNSYGFLLTFHNSVVGGAVPFS